MLEEGSQRIQGNFMGSVSTRNFMGNVSTMQVPTPKRTQVFSGSLVQFSTLDSVEKPVQLKQQQENDYLRSLMITKEGKTLPYRWGIAT